MAKHGTTEHPRKRWGVGSVTVFVCLMIFAVFGLSSPWIDTLDQQWVRCEVTSARAVKGNNLSVSPWWLEVETADCGEIAYSGVFTREKVQKLASELVPGMDYEFRLGVHSRLTIEAPFALIGSSAKEIRGPGISTNALPESAE